MDGFVDSEGWSWYLRAGKIVQLGTHLAAPATC